jgi:hypothetical protein
VFSVAPARRERQTDETETPKRNRRKTQLKIGCSVCVNQKRNSKGFCSADHYHRDTTMGCWLIKRRRRDLERGRESGCLRTPLKSQEGREALWRDRRGGRRRTLPDLVLVLSPLGSCSLLPKFSCHYHGFG